MLCTLRGRVAVSTLTSGQQPEVNIESKNTLWHVGESNPEASRWKDELAKTLAVSFRAVSACVVTTWRGKIQL